MSIIVTIATIPSRIGNLKPCLDSILAQTVKPDRILMWYPEKFRRFSERIEVPEYLSDYPVEIYDLKDDVALNKLTGALQKVEDEEAKIISIDDDMIYPPHMIENLVFWSEKYPHAAIGHKGKVLIKDGPLNYDKVFFVFGTIKTPFLVDVTDAAYGILYKKRFFTDEALHPEVVESKYVSHDLWYSGNLAKYKVPQMIVPYSEYRELRAFQEDVDSLMHMPERNETKHNTMMHFEEAFRENC